MQILDKILIADDDADVLSALGLLFETNGFRTEAVRSPEAALACMKSETFDLLVIDLNYARDTTNGQEGLDLIATIRSLDEEVPIVALTGWGTVETAVSAMRAGVADFIEKPWDNKRLLTIVNNQLKLRRAESESRRLNAENRLLRDALQTPAQPVTRSTVMRDLIESLEPVIATDANILLTGENGTGKSMMARYIHERSPRRENAFMAVNMGAISESLFESEMFGHVKGSFTDARESRIGRLELADSGTLFLDEIANTPLSQQAKLLRAIEDREFERLGDARTIRVDVRLITATNSDLSDAVEEGQFRRDLLYRINTFAFEIPPLRERKDDIEPLAREFLERHARSYGTEPPVLDAVATKRLRDHDWPGNVRELDHVMLRACVIYPGQPVQVNGLGLGQAMPRASADVSSLDEAERALIKERLARYDGNSSEAADSLGLTKSAFYRRLKKHGL